MIPKYQYIIRLDDICPTMNWDNFLKLKKIFENNNIKPIIGIIPDNQDKTLEIDDCKEDFWGIMRELKNKGWIVAMHGYQHLYSTNESGIIGLNKFSEFSGLPRLQQYEKLKKAKTIIESELNMKIEWWMAPAHSFDNTTCEVLKDLQFKYVTDGIALYPFRKNGLVWIPQQLWTPKKKLFGLWTICIHPNSIDDKYIDNLEKFIIFNNKQCQWRVEQLSVGNKRFLNLVFRWLWIFKQKLYMIANK